MKKIVFIGFAIFICTFSFAQNKIKAKVSLNHTAIYVVDLKRSGNFYQHILGLDSIAEPFHDGKHIWLKTGEHTMLHIIQGAGAKKEYYKNTHTCFSIPSVDAFTGILKKNNIVWEDVNGNKNAITTRVDGVHQIWLQDPDGYWLELNDDKY